MKVDSKEEKKILRTITFAPIVFTMAISTIAIFLHSYSEYNEFEEGMERIKKEYMHSVETNLKDETENIIEFVKLEDSTAKDVLKNSIRDVVNNGYEIIDSIYKLNQRGSVSKSETLKEIKEVLREIRFNNGRGYFFVYKIDGECVLLPTNKEMEGRNLIGLKDSKGVNTIKEMIDIVKSGEGFYSWHWYKLSDKKRMYKKIGFGKYYEPLDIFIGTGEYLEDVKTDIKSNLIKRVNLINSKNMEKFTWIMDSNYKLVSHPKRAEVAGKSIYNEVDAQGEPYALKIMDSVMDDELSRFTTFRWFDDSGKEEEFISYASYYKPFDWIIVTQVSTKDIINFIKNQEVEEKKRFKGHIEFIIIIVLSILFLTILATTIFNRQLRGMFHSYTKLIDDRNVKLKELNRTLKFRVDEEVRKNREKDRKLNSQSRLAAIGETMVLISHHWRQPLNVIALVMEGLKDHEWKDKDKEVIDCAVDDATNQLQYLSKTIDEFRNFYRPDSKKEHFEVREVVSSIITLLRPQLDDSIRVSIKGYASTVFGYKSEFCQVILNLVTNSIEAIEKVEESQGSYDGEILIEIGENRDRVKVSVNDNGCGINEDIKDKIFVPYFTTKFQSKGTGLGLYMSKMMVEKSMGGTLDFLETEQGSSFIVEIVKESD